ncbi:MAG: lectin-like protein [Bradymonadia bacterium]
MRKCAWLVGLLLAACGGAGGDSTGSQGGSAPENDAAPGGEAGGAPSPDSGPAPGGSRTDAAPEGGSMGGVPVGGDRPDAATGGAQPPDDQGVPTDGPQAGGAQGGADVPDMAVAPPNPEDIRLNEIDCHGKEWIELINLTDAPIDLAGWTLSDTVSEEPDPTDLYVLPENSVVEPGQFFIVYEGDVDEQLEGFEFGIACGGDEVRLLRPDGSLADETEVPGREGLPVTWGRLPDGTGEWIPTEPTEGNRNRPGVDPGPILFDPVGAGVPVFHLTVTPDDIGALTRDPRTTVQAEMQFERVGEAPTEPIFVGVHLKGRIGSFRPLSGKSGFKVDINWVDGTQRFLGLKELTFNNLVQDRSAMSQWMSYEIFRAMDVCVPRMGYARVILNGTDYGLYAHVENYDDLLFSRCFDSTGHVYEGRYGEDIRVDLLNRLELKEGDPLDRADMEAIIGALDNPPEGGLYATREGQALFDWDRILSTIATEQFIGHWDGYAPTRNNWLMHVTRNGRLSLQPWGTDQCFERNLDLYSGQGRLLQYCMTDVPCRNAYEVRLGRVLDAIEGLDLENRAREVFDVIAPEVDTDSRDATNLASVQRGFESHLTFLRNRVAAISEALECVLGENADPDGDGYRCDTDCAPDDPEINPGAVDTCRDGIDQDCSGEADDDAGCPDCETFVRDEHRYLVCTTPRNWQNAQAHCQAFGSNLAAPDSLAEVEWLMSKARPVRNQDYWIGLNDRDREQYMEFLNGAGFPGPDIPWNAGEPDNAGDEDCVFVRGQDGRLSDLNCLRQKGVLCEDLCDFIGDADRDGANRCGADCDDNDNTRFPGAPEVCGDGVDQDCDEQVDEGENCDCREVFRGAHRYRICGTPRSQADARQVCQAQGSDLVVFNSAGEAVWVAAQVAALREMNVWVGLADRFALDEFSWVNGDVLDFATWRVPFWAQGQPDSGGADDCVVALGADAGRLDDRGCDQVHGVVCEDTCARRIDLDFDGYPACGNDCDDGDPNTHPGAMDVCGDRVDQDCDGAVDEGCR